jgi:hypothetical protein
MSFGLDAANPTSLTTGRTQSNGPHDLDDPATVERLVARPLADLLTTLRLVENLPTCYDEWDTVTPTTGTLDKPGTTFTLTRSVGRTRETVACATVQTDGEWQLRWIEDVGARVATLVTFNLIAEGNDSTMIRYTRAFVVAQPRRDAP